MDHSSISRRVKPASAGETEIGPVAHRKEGARQPILCRLVLILVACFSFFVFARGAQFSRCSGLWLSAQIKWTQFAREGGPTLASFASFGMFRETSGSEHFPLIYEILANSLGGVVLDVGANEAGITIFSAVLGHRVHALEALPVNQRIVSTLACINGVRDRIVLHPYAASDVANEVVCFRGTGTNPVPKWLAGFDQQYNGQALGTSAKGKVCLPGEESIVTGRIDEMVAEDIRLLKIDVEGYEALALKGAEKLFKQHTIDYVFSEFSPCNMPKQISPSEYLNMLDQHGFDMYLVSYNERTTNERAARHKAPFVQLKYSGPELVSSIEMGALRKNQISAQLAIRQTECIC